MDKFSRRFLWMASQMLRDCKLDDPADQAEVRQIMERLQELAGDPPDATNDNGARQGLQEY